MRMDSLLNRRAIMSKCSNSRLKSGRLAKLVAKVESTLEYAYAREYNANVVCNVAYAGSIVFFLIGCLSPRLYKFPFPFVGNMFPTKAKFGNHRPPRTFLVMLFCVHFMRRILELLFVHKFKRKLRILETTIGPFFCWIFSLWMAMSIRPAIGYINTSLTIYGIGTILFILGECFSVCCYFRCTLEQKLCSLFRRFEPSCELPGGFLFPFESGYHLTAETLSWLGFFLATGTLATMSFFIGKAAVLFIYLLKCFKERSNQQSKTEKNGNTIFPINNPDFVSQQMEC